MPGATGDLVLEWARRADAGPFSSVGVLERVVYDSYDPFAALAAAAAATSRVRLATMIAIGPLRSTALLAKQAASVHALSGGRLTLGLAVGARTRTSTRPASSTRAAGSASASSWRTFGATWTATASGPHGTESRSSSAGSAARRTRGWRGTRTATRTTAGLRGRSRTRPGARSPRGAISGVLGQPKLWGQGYFAFGDPDRGSDYLLDYYAFTGPFAEKIAAGNLTSARAVKDYVRGYEEAGCDELVLFPTVPEIDELERLQEALA